MVNAILTRSCNKKCSYCFADNSSKDEMSFDLFKSILDKLEDNDIKLLGGEPTLYSNFEEILKECETRNTYVTLVSNFLFSEKIRFLLLEHIKKRPNKFSFLINSTDLNINNRMSIFKENYNEIYKEMYQFNAEMEITCGITIDENKQKEEYVEYIDYLLENLIAIERIRISLRFPGDEDKNNFYFINNHKLGDIIIFLIKKTMNENIPIILDCIHFPCIYSSKEEFKFSQKFLGNSSKFKCEAQPTDCLPNGKAIHCFPNSDLFVNLNDFSKSEDIKKELKQKYFLKKSKIFLPQECINCKYRNICDGPCMGFFS